MPDWNRYAELGGLSAVLDPADAKGYKNYLLDQIHWDVIRQRIKEGKHLLDFGCGTGRFAARINKLGIRYTGVDRSSNMIEEARKLFEPLGLDFVHVLSSTLPFPHASFDVCLSCYVFQYIMGTPDSLPLLEEIHRVLEPGGRFILVEQATLSNRTSGSVSIVSTENDYQSVLSYYFQVESIEKIRSGNLSFFSYLSFRLAPYMPNIYKTFASILANMEISRAAKLPDTYYSYIPYYDICVTCKVK